MKPNPKPFKTPNKMHIAGIASMLSFNQLPKESAISCLKSYPQSALLLV
jgi:hypothetical protein